MTDDRDERIAELEDRLKDQTFQALSVGTVLVRAIREPGCQLPPVNRAVQQRLARLAYDLEHVGGRPEVAQILATATRNATVEIKDHAAQWAEQSKRIDKEMKTSLKSDEPASVQRNHPQTSHDAAELVMPNRETDWHTVLGLFEEQARAGSNEGFTSYEIGKILDPERSTSTGTSRLGELAGKNKKIQLGRWLEVRKGARRPTRGHATAQVYQLSMAAREKMGLLHGPTLPGFDPPPEDGSPLFPLP